MPAPDRFGLFSVDLAEFSTLYQFPATVQFIGYRPDGSTVTTNFVTDGIIDGTDPLADFQTFYFDECFADLVRFEVPTYRYALDNLVVYPVSEPSSVAPKISIVLTNGKPLLHFTTICNQNYSVEYSPDLSSGSWTNLSNGSISGDGNSAQVMDTNVTMSVNRFYRLKLVQ